MSLTPQKQLTNDYAAGAISSVVLVRVTDAKQIEVLIAGANPWQASAAVDRVLSGSYPEKTILFDQGTNGCNYKYPIPKIGDLWIVFLSKGDNGDQSIRESYPADVAYAADPFLPTVYPHLLDETGR